MSTGTRYSPEFRYKVHATIRTVRYFVVRVFIWLYHKFRDREI